MSSQLIQTRNVQQYQALNSFLNQGIAAGVTTLPVMNTNGAAANWVAQVGETGQEKTEMVKISSVGTAGTSVAVGTTKYPHPENTPVYWVKYDQLIFKRSTAGTAGTATAITNGTVNITPDGTVTQFEDTSGSSTYAYKTAYYNSALVDTSPDSDWITPGGFTAYCLAKLRQRARNKFKSRIDSDDQVDEWLDEWRDQMVSAAISVNEDYMMGSVDVAYAAGVTDGTITAADFFQPRAMWLITSAGTFPGDLMPFSNFDPNLAYVQEKPAFFMRGDNVLVRQPSDMAGTVRVFYYSNGTALVNDTDELPFSLRPFTRSFVDYAGAMEADKDGRKDDYRDRLSIAESQKQLFISQIAGRKKTGNSQVRIVEDW